MLGATAEGTDPRVFAETHSQLYAAYKRGLASLTECLDLVRNGETTIAESHESWTSTLSPPAESRYEDPLIQKSVNQDETSTLDEAERYEIIGYDEPWFQSWLETLSQRERRLIEKRLNIARSGHFLDYTQLRADTRLFEFRFHLGDGKRIFFSFDGDSKIALHAAGSKKDQARLIESAIKDLYS